MHDHSPLKTVATGLIGTGTSIGAAFYSLLPHVELWLRLAAKLAVPLTGDANKAALLSKEAESLLKNPAMRRDSTERRSRVRPAWLNSRLVAQRHAGGIP